MNADLSRKKGELDKELRIEEPSSIQYTELF
jgi:hypothetical protein